jgi:hypothetical protein
MTFFAPTLVQNLDVRLGLLLVEVLVAEAAGRVARCRTPSAQDGEGHPGPCSIRAVAWTPLRARSSSAPAQPTQ